jgi:hypothetical protein
MVQGLLPLTIKRSHYVTSGYANGAFQFFDWTFYSFSDLNLLRWFKLSSDRRLHLAKLQDGVCAFVATGIQLQNLTQ